MLKFWISSAVVTTAISAMAFGAWTYASHRAIAEVDARLAALHAGGIEATHGAIAIDLWHRSMRIADVSLVGHGIEANLKVLDLAGVDPWSADLFAERTDVVGLHVTASLSGPADTPVRLVIDEPTASVTRLHLRAVPLDLSDAHGAAQQAAAVFAAVDAEAASIPSATTKIEFNASPGTASTAAATKRSATIDATYTDVRFDRIHDGKIGAFGYRTAAFASASGDRKAGRGSVEGFRVTDVDVLPYFEIGLSRRVADDGYYPVQGEANADASSFEAVDHAATHILKSHVGAVAIDPSKMSLDRIASLISDIGTLGANTSPDAPHELLQRVSQIYAGVRIASVEIDGMQSTSHENGIESAVKCDRITLTRWMRGRIDEVKLAGLSGDFKNSPAAAVAIPWKLGSIRLAGLDLPRLVQTAAMLQPGAQPVEPGKAMALLRTLSGFEVAGAAIPTPPIGQLFEIDTFSSQWGQFVGDIPTDAFITFKGTLPMSPTDPVIAPLRHLGIPKLAVDAKIHTAWSATDTRLANTTSLSVGRLGRLDASFNFDNVPREAFSQDVASALSAVSAVEFGGLDITLHDTGAIKLFRQTSMAPPPVAAVPSPQGTSVTPPQRPDPVALLKMMLIDPPHANGNLDRLLDAFGQFMAAPGQSLVLSLKPATPIRLDDVLELSTAAPGSAALAELFEKFRVGAEVKAQ